MKCERCGNEMTPHPYGIPKKYCSEQCRKRAESQRYFKKHPEKKHAYRNAKKVCIPWTIEKPRKIIGQKSSRPIREQKFKEISDEQRERNAARMRASRIGRSYHGEREMRNIGDPLYRVKENAREKLRYAVSKGEIKKAVRCERCGVDKHLSGHHYRGYEHPLVVIWLCSKCHAMAHLLNP